MDRGNDRRASEIDFYLGARVRGLRKARGVSQQALADELNLSFQQIQKYESGQNRISAAKLFMIALTFEVPIGYFFEGLELAGAGD
jgi:transcriptional regulator with XRE-family HTH domain